MIDVSFDDGYGKGFKAAREAAAKEIQAQIVWTPDHVLLLAERVRNLKPEGTKE